MPSTPAKLSDRASHSHLGRASRLLPAVRVHADRRRGTRRGCGRRLAVRCGHLLERLPPRECVRVHHVPGRLVLPSRRDGSRSVHARSDRVERRPGGVHHMLSRLLFCIAQSQFIVDCCVVGQYSSAGSTCQGCPAGQRCCMFSSRVAWLPQVTTECSHV